jgi:hypothetical protein
VKNVKDRISKNISLLKKWEIRKQVHTYIPSGISKLEAYLTLLYSNSGLPISGKASLQEMPVTNTIGHICTKKK